MRRKTKISAMHWTLAAVVVVGILCGCSSADSRRASYIQHGKALYAIANYDKARIEFSNAAQIDPNDAEARLLLGQVAEKLGDARSAFGQYQAAVRSDPKAAAPRAAMARLFLLGGQPKRALELIDPVLGTHPDNAELLIVRGGARAQLGDKTGALADAQSAFRQAPDDLYAIALLASLYQAQSEFEKAIAVVQAALARHPTDADLHAMVAELYLANQQPDKAEVELRRMVELEPTILSRRYRLAKFYLQQGNQEAAERTLREVVTAQPDSVEAKLQVLLVLAQRRGIAQAVQQADDYTAAQPNDDQLKLQVGDFLSQNNQLEMAERIFNAAIAHAGNGAAGLAARDRLASIRIDRKDFAGASVLVTEVLKENVHDNDALILRSKIAFSQGQTQAAVDDLRAVLRDQPNSLPLMRTLAQAYQQNNEPELSEQTLRAAVQLAPKDIQSRFDLARILITAGKLDQAGTLLEQLASDAPGSAPVLDLQFQLQLAQKNYDAALVTARAIQAAQADRGVGFYLAGLVEEPQGQTDKAAQDYGRALQKQPEFGEALAALTHLDMRRKRADAALARIDATIARDPHNAVARSLKGEILLGQGHADAAIAAYQETIDGDVDWDKGYQGMALAQTVAKHYDDAQHTLQLGIEKTKGSNLLVGDLGRLYERLGRSADAIALYEGILSKSPNSSFAVNNLAMLLVTYRKDAASMVRAQQLAQQMAASSEVSVIDTRGWVKFKSGDVRGAELLLRQAVDKQPDEPELRYHLGMAQLRSGDQQTARKNLETALNSGQPFIGRDEAKAALAQLATAAPVS